jgi:hypothetical protein
MSCAKSLPLSIIQDCNTVYGKGVKSAVYILPKEGLTATFDAKTRNKITGFELASGSHGMKLSINSKKPYNGTTIESQDVEVGQSFTKTVPIILLADSLTNAGVVDTLQQGSWVAVLEKKVKADDDSAFIVIGAEQGASFTSVTLDPYSDDSNGGWKGSFVEEEATTSQIFFSAGDYESTVKALESLVADTEA